MEQLNVKIGTAGNTTLPCFSAIKSKGYDISITKFITPSKNGINVLYQYDAVKNDVLFSANSPEELLGIITMWELKGNNWRATQDEKEDYEKAYYSAPLFIDSDAVFYDEDGNIIEEN